jgi:hypothetical protein
MAFNEFACRSGGSNMNGGSLASNAEPATTPVYSATNGGWNSGTGVFTPTSGNPSTTVTVGDFASVFLDGATTPVFIGRVTAVNTTTVTVSTTAKSGTAPTTAGSGISINVGGAWLGPNGAVGFPFNFATSTLQSASGDRPRINFKNDATYSITAVINSVNPANPIRYQGYTTTFGDLGKATIDGGTSGASYVLLNVANASSAMYADFIFQNNGATGTVGGVGITNTNSLTVLLRCVVHDIRGPGFAVTGNTGAHLIECEAYNCNQGNGGNNAGFVGGQASIAIRCIAHDNSGSSTDGFSSFGLMIGCISETNGRFGVLGGGTLNTMINCDIYNNASAGLANGIGGSGMYYLENCNFIKNGTYGIDFGNGGIANGMAINCGFGSGTQANTSGQTRVGSGGLAEFIGSVTYASGVTPWVDPANGDFSINLAAAKGAGRGNFMQTAASYAGTIGYPDIGAAQHQDTGGASGPIAQLKSFGRGAPY